MAERLGCFADRRERGLGCVFRIAWKLLDETALKEGKTAPPAEVRQLATRSASPEPDAVDRRRRRCLYWSRFGLVGLVEWMLPPQPYLPKPSLPKPWLRKSQTVLILRLRQRYPRGKLRTTSGSRQAECPRSPFRARERKSLKSVVSGGCSIYSVVQRTQSVRDDVASRVVRYYEALPQITTILRW